MSKTSVLDFYVYQDSPSEPVLVDKYKHLHDKSLTLYAGAKSPGKENETNWLPAPEAPFSLYIRAYWPKPEIISGAWMPPKVEQV